MTTTPDTTLLNGPDLEGEAKIAELFGERPLDEQSAVLDASEIERLAPITDSDVYLGETEMDDGEEGDASGTESLDMLTELELRDGETDEPWVASEEGLTYVPPTDPPVVPGGPEGAQIASGFGSSSLDEPYDADHTSDALPGDDDVTSRVRAALRADAATSGFADTLRISISDGVVTLRGAVDDLDDGDNAASVAEYVAGVVEVIDDLTIRSLARNDA